MKITQKNAAPEIDWSGVDAVIEHEAHPQLAKRIEAIAGDVYGTLAAPGINMIYARKGGETEATPVMIDALANIAGLRANTPIKIYWDKELNNYVWDNKSSIGSYNQATGGVAPPTLPQMAEYWLAVANAALPNAYVLDDATNGLVINTDGVPSGLAPGTARNVAIGASSTAWEARALVNADLPVVDASHGGTGNSTNTANSLLVGAGTSAVTFIDPSTAGRMVRSNGTVWNPYLNNIAATAAPTTGDDSNDGYAVGSYWLDLTNDRIYIAIDVTVGAAIWKPVDLTGTVASVALTVPSFLSVSGSPVTTSGTLAVSLVNQSANTVFAGPSSGGATAPTFRALINDDIGGAVGEPPPIGDVTPNTGDFTALTAQTFELDGFRTQAGTVTITATSDTTLMAAGLTWVANYFTAGRSVRFGASGYIDTGTNKATTYRLKFDGSTLCTITFPASTSGANTGWWIEGIIGCVSTGGSGTFRGQMWGAQNLVFRHGVMTGTHTDDTAATISPDLTFAFSVSGTGSPTLTCTNLWFSPLS